MFGFWYLFFGFLGLVVLGIVAIIIDFKINYPKGDQVGTLHYVGIALVIIGAVGVIVFLFCAIFIPITSKWEIIYYTELYPTYMSQIELINKSPDSLAALAQNQELIENVMDYNEWLARAKASQKIHGCFSAYYKIDLSGLSAIPLG